MSLGKKKVYLQKEKVQKYTEQRNNTSNVDRSFSENSKTISSDYSCLSCNGAISDQWHLNSLDIKKNDSSDAVLSSLESNPTQRDWDQKDSASCGDFSLPVSPEREELLSDTTRSNSCSQRDLVSDPELEYSDGASGSNHSHPEEYLTSMPASPISPAEDGAHTHPEPELSNSTPERIHRRSRTVLYFDSDDDDEGRSHIKESIVLESGSCSGSEEDPIDNVIVAVCPRDRKESFFDVVATDSTSSIAEKSQLIHEDTDLFEILNDATTDQQQEASGRSGKDVIDGAETSQQSSGERENKNEDSTDGGPKHFCSGNSPRRTSKIFMSSSQVGLSSITKAMKKLYQYMAERKAAQSLPGISPSLEFGRLVPRKRLSILVCTWNMAEGRFLPDNVNQMLFPAPDLHSNAQLKEIFIPDVFVVSTQESTPERIEWEIRLQETIGVSHVMLLSYHVGVLYMCVFIRRDLLWYVSQTETNFVQTRAGKQFKTKGACAVAFYLFGSSFLFINSHLTPHEHRLNERIRDYSTIIKSLTLPKSLPPSFASNLILPGGDPESSVPLSEKAQGSPSAAVTGSKVFRSFDYIVWNGDLNFRINLPYVDVKRLIKSVVNKLPLSPNTSQSLDLSSEPTDPETIYASGLQELKKHDQLCQSQKDHLCFAEFYEPEISFLPTYKFDLFSDTYDSSGKRRSPAYTDRILYCGMQKDELNCILYDSCMSLVTSDHKPVVALFESNVDPLTNDLSEKVTPGGGYFERDIYLKAVSRLREKARVSNANPTDTSNLNAIITRNQNGNISSGATSHVCVLQ